MTRTLLRLVSVARRTKLELTCWYYLNEFLGIGFSLVTQQSNSNHFPENLHIHVHDRPSYAFVSELLLSLILVIE